MTDVIECSNLTKIYRHSSTIALSGISLTVRQGQIFTLLGRNGAGKTTFLRIAATQLAPTSGLINVFGENVVRHPERVRGRIAVVPQEARPLPPLTVWDHIYYWLRIRGHDKYEAIQRSLEAIKTVEMHEYRDNQAKELSGGLKQRLLVAMAIATDAQLLFLDEPTLGLDPLSRRHVWSAISDISKEGRTIVLTTHYLDEAEALAGNIAILDKGKVIVQGSPQKLKDIVRESTKIDVYSGFTEDELRNYGKVMRVGSFLRVLSDNKKAQELLDLSLKRHAEIKVAPTSLDDVFVSLVGEVP